MRAAYMNTIESLKNELEKYRIEQEWQVSRNEFKTFKELQKGSPAWDFTDSLYQMESKGEYWFRKELIVPEEFQGIELKGSIYRLGFFLVSPTEVYIENKQVFYEKYWADSKKPEIVITERARPGDTFSIYVHVSSTEIMESIGREVQLQIYNDQIETVIFTIRTFIQELEYIRNFPEVSGLQKQVQDIIRRRVNADTSVNDLLLTIEEIRKTLEPVRKYTKKQTVHCVGHAHIDMNWLWPQEETVSICSRDFITLNKLMDRYPELIFSQSQISVYEFVRRENPEVFEKVKKKIAQGRWEVSASSWTEADLNLSDGESIARHILYSREYASEKLGAIPRILWEPDTFGHPATIPQIALKSGILYYYHFRCSPAHSLYWWKGLDGSKILAFTSIYLDDINPEKIAGISAEMKKKNNLTDSLFVYGVGDHGGGPTVRDIEGIEYLNKVPGLPSVRTSRADDFFNKASGTERAVIPEIEGELNPIFDGCYTSHGDIKELNRKSEQALLNYEKISAICFLHKKDYEETKIADNWKVLFFNQFHDILAGCSIADTYARSREELGGLIRNINTAADDQLEDLSASIITPEDGLSAAVWNLQPFPRKDIVRLPLEDAGREGGLLSVYDPEGKIIPSQIFEGELLFIAEVPAMGYTSYSLEKAENRGNNGKKEFKNIEETGSSFLIENDSFSFEIEKCSGTFISIFDKEEQAYIVEPLDWRERRLNHWNNLFRIDHEAPQDMSSWIIGPIDRTEYFLSGGTVNAVSDGPAVKILRFSRQSRWADIEQDIFIYKNIRRIDFRTKVNWKKKGSITEGSPMLRVSFKPDFTAPARAVYDIPFGNIERPNNGQEYPALKYVDLSTEKYGIGLLSSSKYGFSVQGNTVSMTCLRSSYAPDPDPDTGIHEFSYALYLHPDNFRNSDVPLQGCAFNSPLKPVMISGGSKGSGGTELPKQKSWLQAEDKGIVITCLKKSLYDDAYILRLYEWKGCQCACNITVPFEIQKAEEVSIPEDEIFSELSFENRTLRIATGPYEIKTVKIYSKEQ